jgi:hypothetical protein
MEEALNLHIDEDTLKNNFSKKEIEVIKQLQDAGLNGGKGPAMTQQSRNALMEKLYSINNKPKEFKNKKDMTPEELAEYKLDIKMRLRNKINFKTQSRSSKAKNSMGKMLNNKSNETTISNDSNNTNNNIPMDINNMKDIISKMSGSTSNPEVQQKLESLFSEESIGDLLKDDSMKDKMQELMKSNGFNDLFKQFTEQQQSVTNKKKKKCKKKKKPINVLQLNKDKEKEEEEEELLDEYIKEEEDKSSLV